jgi:hypothetical protein
MRWAELALFLTPFALFAAWRLSIVFVRPWIVYATLVFAVALAGATALLATSRRVPPDDRYQPARIEAGKIVPGAGVPK